MAGWLAHCLVAYEVLEKMPQNYRKFFSENNNIDDFFFGSIAPDIRYITPLFDRSVTHEPFGLKSAFEAFKVSSAFTAGYECHLITDNFWAGNRNGESIADFFSLDVNKPEQKFALYYFVDAYFKEKSNRLSTAAISSNILRANDLFFLRKLGFNAEQINHYKNSVFVYLNSPKISTFLRLVAGFKLPLNGKQIIAVLDSLTPVDEKLNSFLENSINDSLEAILKQL